MKRLRCIGALAILLLALAAAGASGQERMERSVLGAGGGSSGNAGVRICATVGQTAIGDAGAVGRILHQGFWYKVQSSAAALVEPPGAPVTGARSLAGMIWPNPSSGRADLIIDIPAAGNISVMLYDLRGNMVRTVYDGAHLAGRMNIPLDGTDLPSGAYTVVLLSGAERAMVTFHLAR